VWNPGPFTCTLTQGGPTYRWSWSGQYNQQVWLEWDSAQRRARCYCYLKRYGDNKYIEGLTNWSTCNPPGGFIISSWASLVNANSGSAYFTIECTS